MFWSFHNQIALQLERQAQKIVGFQGNHTDLIFSADTIEAGSFAETMIILLRVKSNYKSGLREIDNFIMNVSPYVGKPSSEIESEIANDLYNSFSDLLGCIS